MGSAIELAKKTRRLAQVSFTNGQATAIDVAGASLDFTTTSLEQAQAAFGYGWRWTNCSAPPAIRTGFTRCLGLLPTSSTWQRTDHHGKSFQHAAVRGAYAIGIVALLGWGIYLAFQPVRDPVQGKIEAQDVNVSSKVPGRVGQVHMQLGQIVNAGDLLFDLDSSDVHAIFSRQKG